jgi:hypothetical protein
VEQGFATYSGRLRLALLVRAWNEHFHQASMIQIGCQLDSNIEESWLARLLRDSRTCQMPIQHLLMIHFLGHKAEDYFQQELSGFEPFGSSAWPCLNKVCEHYQQNIIRSPVIVFKAGRPVITLTCSCGFSYSRTGPDTSPEDRHRIGRVVSFGEIWKARLVELNRTGASLREKARSLGVDPATVRLQTQLLSNPYLEADTTPYDQTLDKRSFHRKVWNDLRAANTHSSVSQLRKLNSCTYSWLYRNDRAWLFAHQPPRNKHRPATRRVDWAQRDVDIAKQIPEAVKYLKALTKPTQITISAIGRHLGVVVLFQRHLARLPSCQQLLDAVIEDSVQFALRRIANTVLHYEDLQLLPKRWEFERYAGVDRLKKAEKIKIAIDAALHELEGIFLPIASNFDGES